MLLALAGLVLVAWLVPPLGTLSGRYEFVEALQYSCFALVVPALVVLGAPWALLGLATSRGPGPAATDAGLAGGGPGPRPVDRLADGRRRHPEVARTALITALALAGAVVWRTPPAVDALPHHPWLAVLEAITLLVVGSGLWLELVESPPLAPRLPRPSRVALAAVSMWTIWVLAYLVGLSHSSWYHAYPHHPGTGLSLSADQQLTTGVMWLVSACAFIPVVFWNLVRWLQAEENPDEELHHLVRQERVRGRTLDGGRPSP